MISMAAREAFNGATGPVYLFPAMLDREVDVSKAVVPQPANTALTRSLGDRAISEIGRHPGQCGAAVLWTASVDGTRHKEDRIAARPRYTGLFQWCWPRSAAAR
jgi:hypothetical protein